MHLACLRGEFPRPWALDLRPGLTIIHDRSDGGGSTIRSALNDLVLPGTRVHEAEVTGVDGTLVVAGREVPLPELLSRVPGLIPVRMPRASALHPPTPALDQTLEAAIDAARRAVSAAEEDERRAEREWQADRVRWAEAQRISWEERVLAARSMGVAHARLALAAPVAGPLLEGDSGRREVSSAPLERLAGVRLKAARDACAAAEAALAEAEALRDGDPSAPAEKNACGPDDAGPDAPGSDAPDPAGPAIPDPEAVERLARAVAIVDAHPGIDAVEAAQVAVEWERIRSLAGDDVVVPGEDATRLQAAQERVERARYELRSASRIAGFDRADVEVLEAAHAEVLAAWEAGEGTSGARARLRLDEARAAEQAVLTRMGLASYAAYMASSDDDHASVSPGVEAARRRLATAEQTFAEIDAAHRAAADRPGAAFTATLGALRARAVELLGQDPGADVAGVLRERIAADPLPDLLMAMADVGVPVDRPATREQVVSRARRWIELVTTDRGPTESSWIAAGDDEATTDSADDDGASAETNERIGRDRAALSRARAELAEAETARKSLASRAPRPTRHPSRGDTPDPSRLDLESRAARVTFEAAQVAQEPVVEIGASDRMRGRAHARVALARTELAALEELRSLHAHSQRAETTERLDEVTWRFLAVLGAGLDDFPVSGAGPAPVILREPFGLLSPLDAVRLCNALVGPSLAVQILLITARTEIVAWAARATSDAVSVVTTIWSEPLAEGGPGRERDRECVPTIGPAAHEEVP